jgi:hypothetical protein
MTDLVALYRDDGPLARALGAALSGLVRLPGVVLVVAGLLPLAVAAALEVSRPVAAAVLAWTVIVGGVSTARPSPPKSRWAESPLIRLTEYGGLVWIASLADPPAYAGAFALIAVLTFRHYDLTYRLRHLGAPPAPWLGMGWESRLIGAFALLLLGALPEGLYVAAGILGVAFAAECAAAWAAQSRVRALELDEEADAG